MTVATICAAARNVSGHRNVRRLSCRQSFRRLNIRSTILRVLRDGMQFAPLGTFRTEIPCSARLWFFRCHLRYPCFFTPFAAIRWVLTWLASTARQAIAERLGQAIFSGHVDPPITSLDAEMIPDSTRHSSTRGTPGRSAASCAANFWRKARRLAAFAFGGFRAFGVCHTEFSQRLPDRLLAQPEPHGAFVLGSVGIVANVLGKLFGADLADFSAFIGLWMQALRPAFKRGYPGAEPL